MVDQVFNRGLLHLATSGGWPSTGSANPQRISVLLLSSSYSFDATHNTVQDVSAHELTSASYTGQHLVGRIELSSLSAVENDTSGFAAMDTANLRWTALTDSDSIGGLCTFVSAGGPDENNDLLYHHDLVVSPNGDLDVLYQDTSGMAFLASGC